MKVSDSKTEGGVLHVLLVTSDIIAETVLTDRLQDSGFIVEHVCMGNEAIKKQGTWDFLVVQADLPDMYGLDVIRHFKSSDVDMDVIMLSSSDDKEQMIEAVKEGIYDYIIEPVDPDKLCEILKEAGESRIRKRYKTLSSIDPLTSVYNRSQFEHILEQYVKVEEPRRHPFSLLFVDLDHFKKINDTYGHVAGDQVLRKAAAILKDKLREEDVVARYGGEEFVVILYNTRKADARRIAERMRRAFLVKGQWVHLPEHLLTISVGVAGFPQDSKDKEGVLKCADEALYEAKNLGRNKVIVYKDSV